MILNLLANAASNLAVSTIISYQSGALDADIQAIKDYVDIRTDGILAKADRLRGRK